jgi:hypothetical protein
MIGYVLEGSLFFASGLIIGWNLLPQPIWVKNLYDKILAKFKK